MGAHLYYVGRFKKAIFYSVMFIISLVLFIMGFIPNIVITNEPVNLLLMFGRLASAIYVLDLFFEFGRVVFRRFKVPVLAPENIEDYDRINLNKE